MVEKSREASIRSNLEKEITLTFLNYRQKGYEECNNKLVGVLEKPSLKERQNVMHLESLPSEELGKF